ncbi:MAG: hypothetical protein AB8B69_08380 [Chitinophagales bacterium]
MLITLPQASFATNQNGCKKVKTADFSHTQLLIKVAKGFDFEIDDDEADVFAVQRMLFELHKLVKDSDIISVKKPDLQLTSTKNSLYVFEFKPVPNINNLISQVQSLHFIEAAKKVAIE